MDTPLRAARLRRQETLIQVGKACLIDPGNLSRIERGEQLPGKDVVARLVDYFGGEISEVQIIYPERFLAEGGSSMAVHDEKAGESNA